MPFRDGIKNGALAALHGSFYEFGRLTSSAPNSGLEMKLISVHRNPRASDAETGVPYNRRQRIVGVTGVIPTQCTTGGNRRISMTATIEFLREGKHELVYPESLGLPRKRPNR